MIPEPDAGGEAAPGGRLVKPKPGGSDEPPYYCFEDGGGADERLISATMAAAVEFHPEPSSPALKLVYGF